LIAYLDTQVAFWLASGKPRRLTTDARRVIAKASLLLSPVVLLELEMLYEIRRSALSSQDIEAKLKSEVGLGICTLPFGDVIGSAMGEGWTRDPLDRLIVANAKAAGLAPLVTADENIRKNYIRAVW
jgi:PIN domain nuclease of toxin-antitoxin system